MATRRFGARPSEILDNMAATAPPGASNDSVAGYAVGSMWVDVTGDNAYICVDASAGVAVWDQMTATDIQPSIEDWSGITNAAELRVLDCDDTSVDEVADVLGTLVTDLRTTAILA